MNESRVEVTPGAALFYSLLYYLDDSGWFSAAIPAILCHELGHWIALRLCGGTVRAVRLEIPGLCLETRPFSRRWMELLALAAGPLAGLLWGAAAWAIGGEWGRQSARSALALNAFNLLPALPLDGGRILEAMVPVPAAVRVTTGVAAAVFLYAALRWRLWLCLVPAALLGKEALTA